MNTIPFDVLQEIFVNLRDPSAWSQASRLFREVSQSETSVARWSLVRYDPWRALDRMIDRHPKALTPGVASLMLAKGARFPRWLAQTLLRPLRGNLSLDTVILLLNEARDRYGTWSVREDDFQTLAGLARDIHYAQRNTGLVPEPARARLEDMLRCTRFYPIESSFAQPSHLWILAWTFMYARSWLEDLVHTQHLPLFEASRPPYSLAQFMKLYRNDVPIDTMTESSLADLLQFLLGEGVIVAASSDIYDILMETHRVGGDWVVTVLKQVQLPFDIRSIAGRFIRTVLTSYPWHGSESVFREVYESWPDPETLSTSLAQRRAANRNGSSDLPVRLDCFLVCTLRAPHPEAQYLFDLLMHFAANTKAEVRMHLRLAETCVSEGGFRFTESHFDVMAKHGVAETIREFADLVHRLGHPVVPDGPDAQPVEWVLETVWEEGREVSEGRVHRVELDEGLA
ncbi:hypothetical protein BC938DRAFT_473039, partial [Jimgerdemannia flammicorona]